MIAGYTYEAASASSSAEYAVWLAGATLLAMDCVESYGTGVYTPVAARPGGAVVAVSVAACRLCTRQMPRELAAGPALVVSATAGCSEMNCTDAVGSTAAGITDAYRVVHEAADASYATVATATVAARDAPSIITGIAVVAYALVAAASQRVATAVNVTVVAAAAPRRTG